MNRWIAQFVFLLGLPLMAVSAPTSAVRTPHVVAELVAQHTAVQAGQVIQVGLRLSHQPGWHTYWKNPGDSGLATRLTWQLPPGAQMSDIEWPVPRRIPVGPLVNYGYEGELLLPLNFTPPPSAKPGQTLRLNAQADWLVCKEVCIPESAKLELELPVAGPEITPGNTAHTLAFAQHLTTQPQLLEGWRAELQYAGSEALLLLTSESVKLPENLLPIHLFPHPAQLFDNAFQRVYRTPQGYAVGLRLLPQVVLPSTLRFTVHDPAAVGGESSVWGILPASAEVESSVLTVTQLRKLMDADLLSDTSSTSVWDQPVQAAQWSSWAVLAMALVGGMILNLMPCVFPVLSIKLLSVAQLRESQSLGVHAIAYGLGVVLTFLGLALALLALRQAGDAVGWGFQLQEPSVVFALAVLFFLLGLNLLGLFEMNDVTPQVLARWRDKRPAVDAFASGILAVVAASPCTAPFMGAALGYAMTQSTAMSLAVFFALGLGMALPYMALVLLPSWRKYLPRPGAWMEHLKQALAFPMFATVVWLLWVLGQQAGLDASSKVLLVLVALGWLMWALVRFPCGAKLRWLYRSVLLGIALGLMVWGWPTSQVLGQAPQQDTASLWKPFDEEAVSDHLAQGESVFIDFTAAWCVSCQVNKRLVLDSPDTLRDFAQANVVLMRADWTHRDPKITEALARLGRNGVPVYVLLRPGKQAVLLPELLTARRVREALQDTGL